MFISGYELPGLDKTTPPTGKARDTRIPLEEALFEKVEDASFWEERTMNDFVNDVLWRFIKKREEERDTPYGRALYKRGRKSGSRKIGD